MSIKLPRLTAQQSSTKESTGSILSALTFMKKIGDRFKAAFFVSVMLLITGMLNAQVITVSALSPTSATTTYGTVSTNMTFTVSGTGLSAGIVVNPPTDFSISTSPGSGFGVSNITLPETGGVVAATTIYVRINTVPGAGTIPSRSVSCTSTGATTQKVTIGACTVNPAPLTITANNATNTYGSTLTGGAGSTAFTSSGLISGDVISSVTIAYGAGSSATSGAGTYTGSVTASAPTGSSFTASNYTITYVAGNITVNPAPLTITANDESKVYGTTLAATITNSTAFTSTGLQNGETIGTVTISNGTGRTAAKTVGTYTGAATPSAAAGGTFNPANYSITYSPGNIIVTPASLTITANNATNTYGSTLTGGAGSTAFTTTGLQNSDAVTSVTITYGTGSNPTDAVGTYSGTAVPSAAVGTGLTNYNITYAAGNITVQAAALTITANNVNKPYGTTIAATITNSTAFTSTGLQNGETIGTVTITNGTGRLAAHAIGTTTGTVTPSAAAGGTFNPANYTISYVAGNITITAVTLTITANNATNTYGSTLTGGAGSTAFTTTGLQNSDAVTSVTITYGTGSNPTDAVGTYSGTAVPSGAVGTGLTNYNITYVAGNITVSAAALTITANDESKVYGATLAATITNSTAFTSTGLQNGETVGTVTITNGTGKAATKGVGTYAGQATPSAAAGGTFNAANYTITYNSGSIIVTAAPLTITANALSKTYGTADPTLTYSSTGLVNGDAFTGALARASYGTLAGEQVGAYAITIGTLTAGSNYSATYTGANLTITTAALTVTPTANQSKVFGTNDPSAGFTYTSSGLVNTTVDGVAISDALSGNLGRASGESTTTFAYNLGSVTTSDPANYTTTLTARNFSITKASLTITPTAGQSKVYGTSDPSGGFTYTVSGVVNGVTPQYWNSSGSLVNDVAINDAVSGKLGRLSGETVGVYAYNTGSGAINDPGNYNITLATATFSITKATITINPTVGQSKVYGTTDPVFTYTSTGLVNGVTPKYWNSAGSLVNDGTINDALTGALSRTAGESVGTYPYNIGTLAVNAASNYNALNLTSGTFAITLATPVVTVTGTTSFTYNGSPQGPNTATNTGTGTSYTYSYVGTGSTSYSASSTPPTNTGTYTVTATVAASSDGNYAAASSAATAFTISAATPVVTVTGTTSFTYNGSPQGPNTATNTGTGTSYTYSYVGTGSTSYSASATKPTNAGTYTVTATVAASSDGNYAAASSAATAFTISAATPVVTVTGTTGFTYNGAPQGPNTATNTGTGTSYTYSYAGTGSTSYGPSATQPIAAGTYTVTATVAASSDGNWTSASSAATAFTISAAGSSITVTGSTVYTYNNTAQGPSTYTESGSTGAVTFSYAGTGSTSYGPSGTAPAAAGTYTATATVAADANYNGATSSAYGFTINGAPLTITGNNITKCNGATYTFAGTEFTATGLIAGDGASVSSVTLTSAGSVSTAAAGGYSITPSAAAGTGLSNYVITYSTAGVLTVETPVVVTMIQVNPDCNVSTGSLSSTVTGGIAPYMYELNTGWTYNPGTYGSNATFSGLSAGKYTYAVEDANGCVSAQTGQWLNPLTYEPVLVGTSAAPSTIAVCYGSGVTINTTVFGGNGPYTYYLNGTGTGTGASNRYFTVGAGSYFIKVTDGNGCSYTTNTISVTQPSSALSLSTSVTNTSCNSTTGSVTVTASGGYGGYSYSDNGGSSYQSGGIFTGLVPAVYSLSVKDADGCTATGTANVINNVLTTSAITVSGTGNTQICYGATVTITTTPSGGVPPYMYSLDGAGYVSSSGRYYGVVGSGSHYITVKDANGCTATTATVTLTQPSSALTLSTVVTSPACASGSGTITMTGSGGYGGYVYSDGVTSQSTGSFTGLSSGTYSLLLTDGNGCSVTGSATVKAPTMTATAIAGNLNACYGANTTISTTGSGGASPYTYSLNGGTPVSAGSRYFSVGAGTYAITVIDANGCTYTTASVTVVQPSAAVTFTAVQGGSGCTGNAGIAVTASGGYGGYSYSDNGGSSYQSGSVFTGLGYGSYTVEVEDMNGCVSANSVVKLAALTTSAIQGNTVICPAGGSTTISTVPSGGAAPYSYSLDGGTYVPSNQRYFYVTAGSHTITVEDNQGCTASASATVTNCAGEPQAPTADVNGKTVTGAGEGMFEAKVSPNPAVGAFHLQLSSSDRVNGVELIITDMAGRKMYETKGTADQTYEFGSAFTSGMYILQIRQGNTIHTVKLIKGN